MSENRKLLETVPKYGGREIRITFHTRRGDPEIRIDDAPTGDSPGPVHFIAFHSKLAREVAYALLDTADKLNAARKRQRTEGRPAR
ncbi:hypothetical protein [Aureimonas sp. D3]|uniref:hypothetical protein n=1 Tax=Aureimonas sp. D3 TaxID=1638164 RepID=UPI000B124D98|nr:hypothetical protein [Aureimonas sp. D3]